MPATASRRFGRGFAPAIASAASYRLSYATTPTGSELLAPSVVFVRMRRFLGFPGVEAFFALLLGGGSRVLWLLVMRFGCG